MHKWTGHQQRIFEARYQSKMTHSHCFHLIRSKYIISKVSFGRLNGRYASISRWSTKFFDSCPPESMSNITQSSMTEWKHQRSSKIASWNSLKLNTSKEMIMNTTCMNWTISAITTFYNYNYVNLTLNIKTRLDAINCHRR